MRKCQNENVKIDSIGIKTQKELKKFWSGGTAAPESEA